MIEKHNLVLIILLIIFISLFCYYSINNENIDINNTNTHNTDNKGHILLLNEDTNKIVPIEVSEAQGSGEWSGK